MALTNNVILTGYCAENPLAISKQANGKRVVKMGLYTKHRWHEEGGAVREQQEVHRCLFFGSNATRAIRFLQKGSHVHLQGTIHYETRTRADQTKAYYTQILVEEFMVSDQIAISKEMYQTLFPGDTPHRALMSKTKEIKEGIEAFDQELIKIENYVKQTKESS